MDCIEGMKKLTNIDLIIADPPYNIGSKGHYIKSDEKSFYAIKEKWDMIENYYDFTKQWLIVAFEILKPNGSILIWGSRHNIYLTGYLLEEIGLQIKTHYTWLKTNSMPCLTGRNPSESTEQLIWAVKGKGWTYNLNYAKQINEGKNIRNIFITTQTPPKEKKHGKHPSQKRLEGLTDILVNLHSNEKELIVIPFNGSGTECVAAKKYNRNYIGFELESNYINIANQRLSEVN